MSAYQKYHGQWAAPLPLGADVPESFVDIREAVFDTYDLANGHAQHEASKGPCPGWWAVIELRRRPARSLIRQDCSEPVRLWESGQVVLKINRPDQEIARNA